MYILYIINIIEIAYDIYMIQSFIRRGSEWGAQTNTL